jgi:hypothetical protein
MKRKCGIQIGELSFIFLHLLLLLLFLEHWYCLLFVLPVTVFLFYILLSTPGT